MAPSKVQVMSTELRLASWQSAPTERLRRIGALKPSSRGRSADVPSARASARSAALLAVLLIHGGVFAMLLAYSVAEPQPIE